jgi:hypothetical protein
VRIHCSAALAGMLLASCMAPVREQTVSDVGDAAGGTAGSAGMAGSAGTSGSSGSTAYDRCLGQSDCGKDWRCNVRAGGFGVCQPYCGTAEECGSDRQCLPSSVPGTNVCTQDCNYFDAFGCGADAACGAFGSSVTQEYYSDCVPAGSGKGADACSAGAPYTCSAGYVCTNSIPFQINDPYNAGLCSQDYVCPPSGYCAKWCTYGQPNDCDAGESCKRFYEFTDDYGGGSKLGICYK